MHSARASLFVDGVEMESDSSVNIGRTLSIGLNESGNIASRQEGRGRIMEKDMGLVFLFVGIRPHSFELDLLVTALPGTFPDLTFTQDRDLGSGGIAVWDRFRDSFRSSLCEIGKEQIVGRLIANVGSNRLAFSIYTLGEADVFKARSGREVD